MLVALLVLIAVVPACGKKTIKTEGVSGTITLDGQPLPFAQITFVAVDKSAGTDSYGNSDADGNFKIQTLQGKANGGTTPGMYKVAVTCFKEEETGKTYKDEEGNEKPETRDVSVVPAKYNSAETSGIEVEVKKGSNTINLELQSK